MKRLSYDQYVARKKAEEQQKLDMTPQPVRRNLVMTSPPFRFGVPSPRNPRLQNLLNQPLGTPRNYSFMFGTGKKPTPSAALGAPTPSAAVGGAPPPTPETPSTYSTPSESPTVEQKTEQELVALNSAVSQVKRISSKFVDAVEKKIPALETSEQRKGMMNDVGKTLEDYRSSRNQLESETSIALAKFDVETKELQAVVSKLQFDQFKHLKDAIEDRDRQSRTRAFKLSKAIEKLMKSEENVEKVFHDEVMMRTGELINLALQINGLVDEISSQLPPERVKPEKVSVKDLKTLEGKLTNEQTNSKKIREEILKETENLYQLCDTDPLVKEQLQKIFDALEEEARERNVEVEEQRRFFEQYCRELKQELERDINLAKKEERPAFASRIDDILEKEKIPPTVEKKVSESAPRAKPIGGEEFGQYIEGGPFDPANVHVTPKLPPSLGEASKLKTDPPAAKPPLPPPDAADVGVEPTLGEKKEEEEKNQQEAFKNIGTELEQEMGSFEEIENSFKKNIEERVRSGDDTTDEMLKKIEQQEAARKRKRTEEGKRESEESSDFPIAYPPKKRKKMKKKKKRSHEPSEGEPPKNVGKQSEKKVSFSTSTSGRMSVSNPKAKRKADIFSDSSEGVPANVGEGGRGESQPKRRKTEKPGAASSTEKKKEEVIQNVYVVNINGEKLKLDLRQIQHEFPLYNRQIASGTNQVTVEKDTFEDQHLATLIKHQVYWEKSNIQHPAEVNWRKISSMTPIVRSRPETWKCLEQDSDDEGKKCDRSYPSWALLRAHLMDKHELPNVLICSMCLRYHKEASALKTCQQDHLPVEFSNVKTANDVKKVFAFCTMCAWRKTQRWGVQNQLKKELDLEKFPKGHPGRRGIVVFNETQNILKHMSTHHGQYINGDRDERGRKVKGVDHVPDPTKPLGNLFYCMICDEWCSTAQTKNRHHDKCSITRMKECHICGKVVTGEAKFFSSYGAKVQHFVDHHPKDLHHLIPVIPRTLQKAKCGECSFETKQDLKVSPDSALRLMYDHYMLCHKDEVGDFLNQHKLKEDDIF